MCYTLTAEDAPLTTAFPLLPRVYREILHNSRCFREKEAAVLRCAHPRVGFSLCIRAILFALGWILRSRLLVTPIYDARLVLAAMQV